MAELVRRTIRGLVAYCRGIQNTSRAGSSPAYLPNKFNLINARKACVIKLSKNGL